MDRLNGSLDHAHQDIPDVDREPLFFSSGDRASELEEALANLAVPQELLSLAEIDALYDRDS